MTTAQLANTYRTARQQAEAHKWGGGSYVFYRNAEDRAWQALYARDRNLALVVKAE